MKLENVELLIRTEDPCLLLDIEKTLSGLDVILKADLDDFDDSYKQKMSKGIVEINYGNGFIKNKTGKVIIIGLGKREEFTPGVVMVLPENISNYDLNYSASGLEIISKGENPIRYCFTARHAIL